MQSSVIANLLILLATVLVGLLNYLYTKRTHRASTYPAVQGRLEVRPRDMGKRRLVFYLRNLSTSVNVSNVMCSFHIALPARKPNLRPRRWLLYDSWDKDLIAPSNEESFCSDQLIEHFLCQNMPSFLRERGRHTPTHGRPADKDSYVILRPNRLDLRVTVRYQPGILGASPVKLSNAYYLVARPENDENHSDTLSWWELELRT